MKVHSTALYYFVV